MMQKLILLLSSLVVLVLCVLAVLLGGFALGRAALKLHRALVGSGWQPGATPSHWSASRAGHTPLFQAQHFSPASRAPSAPSWAWRKLHGSRSRGGYTRASLSPLDRIVERSGSEEDSSEVASEVGASGSEVECCAAACTADVR